MKLERFNFFRKKENSPEEILYKEISPADKQKYLDTHKFENFTQSEYLKVKSWLNQRGSEVLDKYPDVIIYSYRYMYNRVYKFVDEWYIIDCIGKRSEWNPQGIKKYYLCDTLDGVLQATKHFKEI